MATSLAIIILGLLSNQLFEKLKLPGLLGMIIELVLVAVLSIIITAPICVIAIKVSGPRILKS